MIEPEIKLVFASFQPGDEQRSLVVRLVDRIRAPR